MYWTTICDSAPAGERFALPASNDKGSRRGGSMLLRLKRNSDTYWSAAMTNRYAAATATGTSTRAIKDSANGDGRRLSPCCGPWASKGDRMKGVTVRAASVRAG